MYNVYFCGGDIRVTTTTASAAAGVNHFYIAIWHHGPAHNTDMPNRVTEEKKISSFYGVGVRDVRYV